MEAAVKKITPENQLHIITQSAQNENEFKWDWDGKEFSYKGKMYDVVRSEKSNGVIKYYCLSDEDETGLYARLDAVVKKQMNDENTASGNAAKNLVKMLLQIYLPSVQNELPLCENMLTLNCSHELNYTSFSSETNSPPPKPFSFIS
jgi:hypothetical protein